MEKNMENEMEILGPFKSICRDLTPKMSYRGYIGIVETKMETTIVYLGFGV